MVMSIAGFDPSGGAGVTADLKVFEHLGLTGFGVCTTLTFQREDFMEGLVYVPREHILKQIRVLTEKHDIQWCKIGLIENPEVLGIILDVLQSKNIKVVLDPIFKASVGFSFQDEPSRFLNLLEKVEVITPNREEISVLIPNIRAEEAAKIIALKTNVYLKGGHWDENPGTDLIFPKRKFDFIAIPPNGNDVKEKHGSGCILSSALAAYLTKHPELELAECCRKAKAYTEKALASSPSLLAQYDFAV